MIKLLSVSAILLCGCHTKPKHDTIYLNELMSIRAQEDKDNWWLSYNTNALRIFVNPIWDAELGLKDDGTVVWRKVAPLK